MFAEITIEPGVVAVWVLVALVVRALASAVGKIGAFGVVGDLFAAVAGALAGGSLVALLVSAAGFWGSIAGAFLGACCFIAAIRAMSPAAEGPDGEQS